MTNYFSEISGPLLQNISQTVKKTSPAALTSPETDLFFLPWQAYRGGRVPDPAQVPFPDPPVGSHPDQPLRTGPLHVTEGKTSRNHEGKNQPQVV